MASPCSHQQDLCQLEKQVKDPRQHTMTSKRSSRLFSEDTSPNDTKSGGSHRPRRNSQTSPKEVSMMAGDEGHRAGAAAKDGTNRSMPSKEPPSTLRASRSSEIMTVTSIQPSLPRASAPETPTNARPLNFGIVLPGLYRSSYPLEQDFVFLQGLKLKTLVTLVQRDELDHGLYDFVTSNGIRQVMISMKGTKKETIPSKTMQEILSVVLDRQNYPLLLHCNHGKHRTGCVVGVIRKVSGWETDRCLDEYKTYAAPKARDCDVEYISTFEAATLQIEEAAAGFNPVQVRTFLRTLIFSTFVMVLWLFSGSQMKAAQKTRPR